MTYIVRILQKVSYMESQVYQGYEYWTEVQIKIYNSCNRAEEVHNGTWRFSVGKGDDEMILSFYEVIAFRKLCDIFIHKDWKNQIVTSPPTGLRTLINVLFIHDYYKNHLKDKIDDFMLAVYKYRPVKIYRIIGILSYLGFDKMYLELSKDSRKWD